jgi:hypothetical protein
VVVLAVVEVVVVVWGVCSVVVVVVDRLVHAGGCVGAWVGLGGMVVRLGRGRMEWEGRGPGAIRAVLVRRPEVVGWGPWGWGAMVVVEEGWASVLLWWAFGFEPEILLNVALKEKLDSRLGFIEKGFDVTGPSGLAWPCLLKMGILDLLA